MATDLDDKLREILKESANQYRDNNANCIAQIKKLFEEAGYVRTWVKKMQDEYYQRYGDAETGLKLAEAFLNGEILMTGQEWLERFEKELIKTPKHAVRVEGKYRVMIEESSVFEAAERASGVEDD